MKVFISVLLVLVLYSVVAVNGHVCLVNPPQRGGFPAGSLEVKGVCVIMCYNCVLVVD